MVIMLHKFIFKFTEYENTHSIDIENTHMILSLKRS